MVRHVPYFLLIVPVLLISHLTSSPPFGTQLYCCVHIFYTFIVTSTCFITYLLYALQL
ncbi:hypothetical protein C8F04DRAFT_1117719, partial [Mycena alexandri]